ncbi:unnamed protein product, partial [Vitis vinifera]|uniref:Histone H2A n=1 Tax=Vitis vinifera TaxID=29760 RepID=D7TP69_VITVI
MSSSNKGGRGKLKASKLVSQSQKASLQFIVGQIAHFLKSLQVIWSCSSNAPVYVSAFLEYLAVEVLELSGNVARAIRRIELF